MNPKGKALGNLKYESTEKKVPKITKHADRFHHMAEAEAQKADPHYEMADRPHMTKGSKVYSDALKRMKK